MKYVYLLQHSYLYGKNNENEETKVIGIYDDENKARSAIREYIKLPGFKDFSEDCFSLDRYVLNVGEWREGFIEMWFVEFIYSTKKSYSILLSYQFKKGL